MLKYFLFLVWLTGLAGHLSAQTFPASKNNQLSDQQLMQLYQQAKASGMSDNDIMTMLQKKGLSAGQATGLQSRLSQLQGGSKGKAVQDSIRRDTVWVKEVPEPKKPLTFYGADFFNTPNRSFAPAAQMATPKNYVLGTDDELVISLTGLNETTVNSKVSPEGNLKIPYAGMISVNGLTIEQATERIRNKMKQAYPALASGKTQLLVTLGNIRTVRVTIIGEAQRPGSYAVSSLATLFNVLYLSGGPTENGSLRRIELIRDNRMAASIDFYQFLQKGIMDKNIRLQDQDIIRFPVYEKHVVLSGGIKRPALYELLDKETLADLVAYGGGFADGAYRNTAKIVESGTADKKVKDVVAADFSYYLPKNADSVYFGKINDRFENRVVLTGAVNRPGTYELTNALTLRQLVDRADGLREDVFTGRGYIRRQTADMERQLVSFEVKALASGGVDLPLQREDSIFILAKDSLRELPAVTIGGAVRAPGTFFFREGMRVEDLIAMAGGFTIDAANHRVEVSRLNKNTADTLANQLVQRITLQVDSSLQNSSGKYTLAPLDYVFVPQLLNYQQLGNISIRGEVLYPGDYALERRNESVQELMQRAGGVSPFASVKNVQVYRKGLRVGTEIFASDGTSEEQRFLLLPGDSIYIPRNESFVEISGEVFNQQIVSYTSKKFMYYVSAAGGVTDQGKLKKAYIQYSNGINRKIRHFLFFRNYPKVLPGSKIIVPQKSIFDSSIFSASQLPLFTGVLTTLVALVALFKN